MFCGRPDEPKRTSTTQTSACAKKHVHATLPWLLKLVYAPTVHLYSKLHAPLSTGYSRSHIHAASALLSQLPPLRISPVSYTHLTLPTTPYV